MPLYDMRCPECDREFEHFCKVAEREDARCPECGSPVKILITCARNKDWFQPHINENFNDTPIEVRSRQHLKDLCRQYDVTSRALGDCRPCRTEF